MMTDKERINDAITARAKTCSKKSGWIGKITLTLINECLTA